MGKVRLVLGMAMGRADSGEYVIDRIKPQHAPIVIDGIKAMMKCEYIDMDTVNEIREEAHRLVDMMCDLQEASYGK